ncbi:MAG: xanthine dehydrogenase family protein subunit M [Acidobacteriota bacterium]|nr:xanthine dehydrogenase family protein subunit M [Acidobacteriota bacterium]
MSAVRSRRWCLRGSWCWPARRSPWRTWRADAGGRYAWCSSGPRSDVKPPSVEYVAPTTIEEALAELGRHGEDGKILAGGQSLVPLLNFRLARPRTLIDINRVQGLSYIRRRVGALHVGALTRHSALERSRVVREGWPLLAQALRELAHPQIRNRGTVGGSVAHADPAAELPVVLTALGATFVVRSSEQTRVLDSDEMFLDQLTSGLDSKELLLEIRVPEMPLGAGWAFLEFARRQGDFALGGVAVVGSRDGAGQGFASGMRIVLLGAAGVPLRATEAEGLVGSRPFDRRLAREAAVAAAAASDPPSDIHGDERYRRHLLEVLTERALVAAWERSR